MHPNSQTLTSGSLHPSFQPPAPFSGPGPFLTAHPFLVPFSQALGTSLLSPVSRWGRILRICKVEISLHREPWPRVGLRAHQVPSLDAASPSLPPQLPSSCPCPSLHSKFSSLLCCHLLFQKLLHIACPPPPWGGLCVCVHMSGSQVLCLCVPVCTARVDHASSVCMWLCHVNICVCNMLVSCWGVCVCGLSPTLEVPRTQGGGAWRTNPLASFLPSFKPWTLPLSHARPSPWREAGRTPSRSLLTCPAPPPAGSRLRRSQRAPFYI